MYYNSVIFLDSPGECLKERICGRRLDPVTGERYDLKRETLHNSPFIIIDTICLLTCHHYRKSEID